MARIRSIKPSFFLDSELATLSPMARLFFIGLWCLADREGRLKDKPMELGVQLIPYDMTKSKPEALLKELEGRFVGRYEANGSRFIVVRGFQKHQRPANSEPPSECPAPPSDLFATNKSVASSAGDEEKGQEGKGREGKGKEGNGATASPSLADFQQFWTAYPKKVGKGAAWKSWQVKKPPLTKCLRTLSLMVQTPQWNKPGPNGEPKAYIPHPTTWLNQERWMDVPEGFEEFNCGHCGYEGALKKGFRGNAICPQCKKTTQVGITEGDNHE